MLTIALIFGFISFIGFKMDKLNIDETSKIIWASMIIAVFVIILGTLEYTFGIFLLIVFYVFSKTIYKDGIEVAIKRTSIPTVEMVKTLFYILVSIAVVIISARFVVESSINITNGLGIAEAVIGATIISLGTTLPEISVAIAAIRSKNIDLAVGDGIGSIITNITLVLGTVSIINTVVLNNVIIISAIFMILVAGVFSLIIRNKKFERKEGILLLSLYVIYLLFILTVGNV